MYNFDRCVKIDIINIDGFPYHINKNLRILYVLSGEIEVTWVSGKQKISQNEIEIINVNEPSQISKCGADNVVAIFEIDMEFAKKYCDDIDATIYNCNCDFFFPSRTKQVDQAALKLRLIQIYKIYANRSLHYKLPMEVMEAVLLIKEKFNDIKNIFSDNMKSDIHAERFLRINHYLISNINKKLSLKEIAAKEYLSPHYVSKEFNEKLNKSFQAIVDYYRVKKSVMMLISTDMSITSISEDCGFSANRYFYEKFRCYMDCTPVQFRKELRKQIPCGKRLNFDSEKTAAYFESADREISSINNSAYLVYLKDLGEKNDIDIFQTKNLIFIKSIKGDSAMADILEPKDFCALKKGEYISALELAEEFINNKNFGLWYENVTTREKRRIHPSAGGFADFIGAIDGKLIWHTETSAVWKEKGGLLKGIMINVGNGRKRYSLLLGEEFEAGMLLKETIGEISADIIASAFQIEPGMAERLLYPSICCEKLAETSEPHDVIIGENEIILFIAAKKQYPLG